MADRQIDRDGLNRQMAFEGLRKFCEAEGIPDQRYEERPIDGGIQLIGRTPEGREFGLAYEHDYIYPLWLDA